MIVRQAQMEQLVRPARTRFEQRAAAFLAQHFSERAAAYTPEAWLVTVRALVDQALRMGLSIDRDVLEFTVYAMASSEHPVSIVLPAWFQEIADDATSLPISRLAALSIACPVADAK